MQNLMPPIDTTDHAFHDGDPTTGQLGTIVTAAWLNDVQGATRDIQAEIIAVLTKAGMQPNPQKQNQLAEAISQIIGSGGYATSGDLTLGLSKKIDKADIAQQLGNDTTKVPSLHLVATELGKKASIADANSKLAKDKNGADIPDKEAFIGNLGLVNNGAVGRLIGRPMIITSSGTYTPTSGAKFAWVQIVGGGGGGGGATSSQNFNAAGGGGGAGGYAAKWVDLSSISSVVVTIGAGGNGASASGTNGSSGGITSFGSIFSASGGSMGNSAVGTGNNTSTIVGAGNQGGTGTGGDLNCSGGSGLGGVSASPTIAGASVGPGIGGSSILSGPGGYGAGGNGGATVANSVPGSSGRSGIAIIWEYA